MNRRVQKVYRRKKDHLRWGKIVFRVISRLIVIFLLVGSVAFFVKKFYNYLNYRVVIKQFVIKDGDKYSDAKLDSFLNRYIGKSLFFSTAELKKGIIILLPEIKEVKIRPGLGGKISLSLIKREPLALFGEGAIDKEGKSFPLSFTKKLPLISEDEKNLNKIINFLNWVKKENVSFYQKIGEIHTSENNSLVFVCDTGEKIIWGEEEKNFLEAAEIAKAKEKMQYLLSVLSDLNEKVKSSRVKGKTDIIDLSFYPEGGIVVQNKK